MSRQTAFRPRGVMLANLAAVAVMTTADPALAAQAVADTTGEKPNHCVTMAEYNQVAVHMTRGAVHRVFDTVGHRTSITHHGVRTDEVREYKACNSPDSTVTVSYRKGSSGPFRVIWKTAVWVT